MHIDEKDIKLKIERENNSNTRNVLDEFNPISRLSDKLFNIFVNYYKQKISQRWS